MAHNWFALQLWPTPTIPKSMGVCSDDFYFR